MPYDRSQRRSTIVTSQLATFSNFFDVADIESDKRLAA
jgi:hypothetical protein